MSLWSVTVRYLTKIEPGLIEVEYDVDDLADVSVIVNQGPRGFQSVAYIHVRRGNTEIYPLIPIEGGDPVEQEMLKKIEEIPDIKPEETDL
jgi:hypothetical protein